jgi:hypothetical protein
LHSAIKIKIKKFSFNFIVLYQFFSQSLPAAPVHQQAKAPVQKKVTEAIESTLPTPPRPADPKPAPAPEHTHLSEKQAPYNSCKLIVVGKGSAGKTSSVCSLVAEPFDRQQPSTVGAHLGRTVQISVQQATTTWTAGIVDHITRMVNASDEAVADSGAAAAAAVDKDTLVQQLQEAKAPQQASSPPRTQSSPSKPKPKPKPAATPALPSADEQAVVRELYSSVALRAGKSKSGQYTEPVLAIYDFGGQPVFYDMLSFLMSR